MREPSQSITLLSCWHWFPATFRFFSLTLRGAPILAISSGVKTGVRGVLSIMASDTGAGMVTGKFARGAVHRHHFPADFQSGCLEAIAPAAGKRNGAAQVAPRDIVL